MDVARVSHDCDVQCRNVLHCSRHAGQADHLDYGGILLQRARDPRRELFISADGGLHAALAEAHAHQQLLDAFVRARVNVAEVELPRGHEWAFGVSLAAH